MTEEQTIEAVQQAHAALAAALIKAGCDPITEAFWREYWSALLLLVYRNVSGDGKFSQLGTEKNIRAFADGLRFIANEHFTDKPVTH